MIWLAIIVYHVAVALVAYRLGSRSAGRGVAALFVGVVAFQLYVNGPGSFISGGCQDYSIHASDC